jgi:LPS export ABC transporter protein LptC
MKKIWLTLAGIMIVALVVWWVVVNTDEINKKIENSSELQNTSASETIQAKEIHIIETDQGKKVWELIADNATYEDKNVELSNVKGKFFGEGDELMLTFESPLANYIQEKHHVSLQQGAKVQHPLEKITITSDTMHWDNKSKEITAQGNVKVAKEGFGTSYGDKTIFSSDFNKIRLEGNTYSELSF